MACENDKCEKYGLHHDYENGVEVRKCHACMRDEIESFFPPPWNIYENHEKTEGWIEFQKEMKKNPKYYLEEFLSTKINPTLEST